MTVCSALKQLLALIPLALVLSGCFMPSDTPVDEEKDPHYLAGKNRMSSLDYDGAIAAFESALVSNPKSAAAHLELGLLYEERKTNDGHYSAALYHLEKHLELRPDSNMADTVKQHVFACKLELAKTVSFFLVNRQVQDELRRLYTTNSALVEKIDGLQRQFAEQLTVYSNRLAAANQAAAQAHAQAQAQAQAALHSPAVFTPEPDRRPRVTERPERTERPGPSESIRSPQFVPIPSLSRTHLVRPGESFASIAKKYNLKQSALQTANPSVEPRRLKAGQILNLPAVRY
jgi:tetratricopeptide (TPR) repeat protein